ncbi:MAG: carboxylating nicotinate-nucleotide diphosphorylase [Gammaproteobacteria bacterium]
MTITPEQLHIGEDVRRALEEDVGTGDLTAELIDADAVSDAHVVSRERAVICGQPWFNAVFAALDARIEIEWLVPEGEAVEPGTVLCRLHGPSRGLLSGERAALNFLQTLSGTATTTHEYVSRLNGTACRLLDTRKTLPGLRRAQKYAVACGGGHNHRMGLFDAILIKENHIAAAGSITAAVARARALHPEVMIEVETENLAEVDEALETSADVIMLDDFELHDMRAAAKRTAGRKKLEASGGMGMERLRAVADTGVDYISVGALTKNVRAVDLSMRFEAAG